MKLPSVSKAAPVDRSAPTAERSPAEPGKPCPTADARAIARRTRNGMAPRQQRALPPAADDVEGWSRVVEDTAMAGHLYGIDLPTSWQVDTDLTDAVKRATGLGHVGEAFIGRKRSGFNAEILSHGEKNEVMVSFPGTTAGARPADDVVMRGFKNKRATAAQGLQVVMSRFTVPQDYKHADAVLRSVLQLTELQEAPPHVRVVGHSKGGQEGLYASARQTGFVQVDAFSVPPLSSGAIARSGISEQRRAEMQRRDTIGHVPGDYTRGGLFKAVWSRAPDLGQVYEISVGAGIRSGGLNRHDDFHVHARAALEAAKSAAGRDATPVLPAP